MKPSTDHLFSPVASVRGLARELYMEIADLPIVSPHSHVDAHLFSDPQARFGSPAELFIIPDHYITRMLYSQGITMDEFGAKGRDGSSTAVDQREIWRLLCRNFDLFRGTPSGVWLKLELQHVFGVEEKLCEENADALYDRLVEQLGTAKYAPRALFERFNIQVLCTTDAATDELDAHQALRAGSWQGRILPTFRPDDVTRLGLADWRKNIDRLSALSGIEVKDYRSFIRALEQRRLVFKELGAVATDQDANEVATGELGSLEVEGIFQRALIGRVSAQDRARFNAHMLMEMARMSCEDGLVMQLHTGVWRNHNQWIHDRYGADRGGDIPKRMEYTRNLHALLNKYGNHAGFRLIIFTLDESAYARELAPLAGFYPALRLGSPWWFHDSLNGMARYFDQVIESAGLRNTAGFVDDTRAFCSIPARHEVWRRASANWVAGLLAREVIDREDASAMMQDLAKDLALRAYRLEIP